MRRSMLPVRPDVTEIEGHRKPTPYEIRFGEGAIHYKTFPAELWFHPDGRFCKCWIVCPNDGLMYYH